jgi:hypothetical protein
VTEIVLAAPVSLPERTSLPETTAAYTGMPLVELIFSAIAWIVSPAATPTSTAVPPPSEMWSSSAPAAAASAVPCVICWARASDVTVKA